MTNKKILIVDRGLYVHLAPFMARYFGEVYYHCVVGGPYLNIPQAMIGKGLDGVTWVDSIWKVIDKVDMIFFPDTYDGELQAWLRGKGYKVCGSGHSEIMELDKVFFHQVLDKVGLPSAKTLFFTGLDDVSAFLKGKKQTFYAKNAEKYRDDWETTKFDNPYDTELFLNQKRADLGVERSKSINIMLQEKIDSGCEAGIDAFMLDGEICPNPVTGYEVKDQGYIGAVTKTLPAKIQEVTDKLKPVYKKLGYSGPYSNELRITKDGTVYPIDESCRCPSPPTAVFTEMFGKSYAEGIWDLAHGIMPKMKPVAKYGAEIILSSEWHKQHELYIGCPKNFDSWLKLKNAIKRDGHYYCIENNNDGIFGSIVGIGNTVKEATEEALEMLKQLKVRQMKYKEDLFSETSEIIDCGKKHGISF